MRRSEPVRATAGVTRSGTTALAAQRYYTFRPRFLINRERYVGVYPKQPGSGAMIPAALSKSARDHFPFRFLHGRVIAGGGRRGSCRFQNHLGKIFRFDEIR